MISYCRRKKIPNRIGTFLSLSLAVSMIASCVLNDRTLGEQFITEDYVLKVCSTSFDVPVKLRFCDTSQSVSYKRMMVGWINDPVYGLVMAGGSSFITPLADSANFGTNPEVTRVYMTLSVDSTMYFGKGDDAIPQTISLYEIVKDVSKKVCNYSITPDCLASEPLNVGSPMIFGTSSLSIELKKEYGEKLLTMTQEECTTDSLFQKRFFGIYVQPEVTEREVTGRGGRLSFLNLYASTVVVEYVLNDPARGFVDKDTSYTFLFGYSRALNQFQTGSGELADENPSEVLYVDGLSGVKPVIPAEQLKYLIDEWVDSVCRARNCRKESILVSRARLIFPYEMPEDYELFEKEHPLSLFPFTRNRDGIDTTLRLSPIDAISGSGGGGSMDRSHEYYYSVVTKDIQKMISKMFFEYDRTDDWWICPLTTYVNSTAGTTTYLMNVDDYKRVVLCGPGSDRAPKLEIVYAILNDW